MDNRPCQYRQTEIVTEAPFKRLHTMTPPLPAEAVTLRMRGLNIQWPFSQLLVMGVKTEEVRRYDLGYKCITKNDEDIWIVETKGTSPKASKNAFLDGLPTASRPSHAQIIGTITFDKAYRQSSRWVFCDARDHHCISSGSKFEWDDSGTLYGWRVSNVPALKMPEPVETTGMTGFGPRSYPVVCDTTAPEQPINSGDSPPTALASMPLHPCDYVTYQGKLVRCLD